MASSNNSKIISDARPHTVKKFELIETYIKSWAQILMLNNKCSGIVVYIEMTMKILCMELQFVWLRHYLRLPGLIQTNK